MPVLTVRTNSYISHKDTFLTHASKLLAEELDKPESYVMVEIYDDANILFAGNDEPLAFMELRSLGLDESQTPKLSAVLCQLVEEELGIHPNRVYIEFISPSRKMFGWNGGTF